MLLLLCIIVRSANVRESYARGPNERKKIRFWKRDKKKASSEYAQEWWLEPLSFNMCERMRACVFRFGLWISVHRIFTRSKICRRVLQPDGRSTIFIHWALIIALTDIIPFRTIRTRQVHVIITACFLFHNANRFTGGLKGATCWRSEAHALRMYFLCSHITTHHTSSFVRV